MDTKIIIIIIMFTAAFTWISHKLEITHMSFNSKECSIYTMGQREMNFCHAQEQGWSSQILKEITHTKHNIQLWSHKVRKQAKLVKVRSVVMWRRRGVSSFHEGEHKEISGVLVMFYFFFWILVKRMTSLHENSSSCIYVRFMYFVLLYFN